MLKESVKLLNRVGDKKMTFKPVISLSDIFAVRRIRNECRLYLTGRTDHISIPRQIFWYFTYYKQAAKTGKYRIFIARDGKDRVAGYGAIHRLDRKLLVTECVAEKFRGQGVGFLILKRLMGITRNEKLPIIAEIRATNKISIALHKKCGFTLDSTNVKSGYKLCVYKKYANK
jgi:RimJ/RimL family protein N-acetyltransferase